MERNVTLKKAKNGTLRNGIEPETAKLEFMATAFLLTKGKTENLCDFAEILETKQNWN